MKEQETDRQLLSILPELDISLSELQRHVADAPAPGINYRYPAMAVIAAIGLGLYFLLAGGGTEKNIASNALSVQHSSPVTSLPPVQAPELKNATTSTLLLSRSTVKRNPAVSHVKNNETVAVHETKNSALLDAKTFTAFCGKNAFIALTAKPDPMQRLDPASSDFMNSATIGDQTGPQTN